MPGSLGANNLSLPVLAVSLVPRGTAAEAQTPAVRTTGAVYGVGAGSATAEGSSQASDLRGPFVIPPAGEG